VLRSWLGAALFGVAMAADNTKNPQSRLEATSLLRHLQSAKPSPQSGVKQKKSHNIITDK
jgi:hypothetical protein